MDTSKDTPEAQRRSIRIRWEISIRLTSLDPATPFTEQAQTLVVNPQGCGVRLGRPLPPGLPVQIDGLPGGISVTATVANCVSLGTGSNLWLVGVALDEPANVWGVQTPPADWGTGPAKVAVAGATPDLHKRENWPFSQFSSRGEFHPGRK